MTAPGARTALAGPVMAMAGVTLFSLNDAAVKSFAGTYAMHEVMLIRSLVAVGLIGAAVLLARRNLALIATRRPVAHIVRSLVVIATNLMFFLGIAAIPLAEAMSIFFAAPLLITVFSVIFLREMVGPWRWAAVALGFAGVLAIVRPGTEAFQPAALFPLAAAALYAGLQTLTRVIGRTEGPTAMAFYVQLTFAVMAALIGLAVGGGAFDTIDHPSAAFFFRAWTWPAPGDVGVMALQGLAVAAAAWLISNAYRVAESGLVAPFEYVAVPLAILWGVFFFGEVPEPRVWGGIVMILGAGLITVWREVRQSRVAPPPGVR